MTENSDVSDQFRTKMSEWVNLKKQLGEARKDMKVLNNTELNNFSLNNFQ